MTHQLACQDQISHVRDNNYVEVTVNILEALVVRAKIANHSQH